jgi:hypothetical protein
VEDARFCHACGKPVFEEDAASEEPVKKAEPPVPAAVEAPPPPPVTPPPAKTPPKLHRIDFHNPVAIRTALLCACVGFLLAMPIQNFPIILGLLFASGFFAAYLYKRRTGTPLDGRNGFRLGWITGLIAFVMLLILQTVSVVMLSFDDRSIGQVMLEAAQQSGQMQVSGDQMAEIEQVLSDPLGLTLIFAIFSFMLFITITLVTGIGGALGAKYFSSG